MVIIIVKRKLPY